MFLHPMLSQLSRNRLMPSLIVLQIAIACAILGNTLFLLLQQAAPLLIDDGLAGDELVIVDQLVSRTGQWNSAQTRAGADALAAIPGVRKAGAVMGAPMRQTLTLVIGLKAANGRVIKASGYAGEQLVDTLGLQLSRGRDFSTEEYREMDFSDRDESGTLPVIITEAMARVLFPDSEAVGGHLQSEDGSSHYVVIGVLRHLLRYQVGELDDGRAEYSLLIPNWIGQTPLLSYVLRIDPAQRRQVMATLPAVLAREFDGSRIPAVNPFIGEYQQLRHDALHTRRAAVWLLSAVNLIVASITLIGIASLSGYWIQQRHRQIGIRRALGATRGQILRYFLAENLLLTALALVIGTGLTLAINQLLMQHYELTRLPWRYLPIGALLLIVLGQLAVLGPSRRAAAVAPAVATRSI